MPPPARTRRFIAPHPLVTIAGFAVALAVFLVGRATSFQPPYAYIVFTVVFAVAFSAISRRSARRQHLRRERDLAELRRKPVFGLDDPSDSS
jgi:hypothetical protein